LTEKRWPVYGDLTIDTIGPVDVAVVAFEGLTGAEFDLLSQDDLDDIADGLEPGSSGAVVVWENSWAARLGAALRGSGGELLLMERVPRETVAGAIAAPTPAASAGSDRIAELTALATLKAQGALSETEFAAEKARLLSS
jgi:hypothetical protein